MWPTDGRETNSRRKKRERDIGEKMGAVKCREKIHCGCYFFPALGHAVSLAFVLVF